uniref:Uncharacterized protein n=1 Tax=Anguilla anguilla TaxID=7936 RepID=A0A0E9QQN9_ANGAN
MISIGPCHCSSILSQFKQIEASEHSASAELYSRCA